jgi:hypothetical protein
MNLIAVLFVEQYSRELFINFNFLFLSGSFVSAAILLIQRGPKRVFLWLSQITALATGYIALMVITIYVVGSTYAG